MIGPIDVLLADIVGVPVIEVPTPVGDVDLHNFADFSGLEYEVTGELRLIWLAAEPGKFKFGHIPISRAVLVFEQVSHLAVTARDPEMPVSEDQALEEFYVLETGAAGHHLRFNFAGGRVIELRARRIELWVDHEVAE